MFYSTGVNYSGLVTCFQIKLDVLRRVVMIHYVDTFISILPWVIAFATVYTLFGIAIVRDSKRCKKMFIEEENQR